MIMESDTEDTASKTTLLYVDDDPANLKLVMTILKLHTDMTFLSAGTGEEGIALAKAQLPDIILLDINMPDMDGFQILARLQAMPETLNTPVLALSGNNQRSDIEEGVEQGFKHYLAKPLDIDNFLVLLKSELA